MNCIKTIARMIRARIAGDRAILCAGIGVLTADGISIFLRTFRHAALAAHAAQSPRQSAGQILLTGWAATFLVTSIVTYAVITAVAHARKIRLSRRVPAVAAAVPDFS